MPLRMDDLLQDSDISDPLSVERSSAVDDEEAIAIEILCRAATPGPLVTDDMADGQGSLMVTLPDGRSVISLSHETSETDARLVVEANIQLICRSRHLLLRLLRDRSQLHERLRELEELVGPDGRKTPAYPR